ncbi:CheB methylesterase domain-containing protein [Helicobacter burdigaliensis]|uniref:CheB methylesterase domain-containing protein n=1 Tax=Helicobacter burdigaliensis TaxID=2315334 RepID=UPI0038CC0ADB
MLVTSNKYHPDVVLKSSPFKGEGKKIIAIGASTGGVEAIAKILQVLPLGLPPIIITQHIPDGFSSSFAKRLNDISQIQVQEVCKREMLKSSCAYLAAGDKHLVLEKSANDYYAKPLDGEKVSRHRPSVDVMFRSLNNVVGKSALAIILTGMGDDGSIGIKELHSNGAYTIAQDEESCIVFGMPKQAISRGAIVEIVPLENIAQKIIQYAKGELKRHK